MLLRQRAKVIWLELGKMEKFEKAAEAAKSDAAIFDAAELFERTRPSVVNVISEGGGGAHSLYSVGSGFFIHADKEAGTCEIATVNHIVVPSSRVKLNSIEVSTESGAKYQAKLSKQDLAHDLAYLSIEGVKDPASECPALKIASTDPVKGESIERVSRMPREASGHEGKFAGQIDRSSLDLIPLAGEDPNRKLYKFDLYNNRDEALGGAPVLNARGEVVAVNAGGLSRTESLAVPAAEIQARLTELEKTK